MSYNPTTMIRAAMKPEVLGMLDMEYYDIFSGTEYSMVTHFSIDRTDDSRQRLGVDGTVTFTYDTGATQTIMFDDKLRYGDYSDCLLEIMYSIEDKRLGWANDPKKITGMIMYITDSWVYIVDYATLRRALLQNWNEWTKKSRHIPPVKNVDDYGNVYHSDNVKVKWHEIEAEGVVVEKYKRQGY